MGLAYEFRLIFGMATLVLGLDQICCTKRVGLDTYDFRLQ